MENLSLLETLYREHFRRIYNYAYMRLLDEAAAEDVTQEVFLAAFTAIERFDPARGSSKAWLYKIAANLVTNYRKLARSRREISVGAVPETAFEETFDTEGPLGQTDNLRAERILAKLSEGERELLAMRYAMGLTNEEIGRSIASNAAAVSQRFSRLLKKCRCLDAGAKSNMKN